MRLRTKLAVVLLLITLVLSGATYGGLEFFKQQQREEVRADIDRASSLAAGGIGNNLERKEDVVGYVASRAGAAELDDPDRFASSFLERNAQSSIFAVKIIDVNGTVRAFESSGYITDAALERGEGRDVSDADYYRCAVVSGATCTTAVEFRPNSSAGQQYFVEISSPIIREGRVTGVFTAAVFVNEDSFFAPLTPLATEDRQVRVVANDTEVYSAGSVEGTTIATNATVPSTGWTVYIARDASDLNRQLQWLGIAQGVGLFFVLSSIVGFGYWQYNTSMRQAETLVDAFDRLQEGDYDYEVSLTAGEEWEEITDGYNEMSAGIKTREEQLRDRQQRLEVLYRVIRHNLRNEMSVILNYADIASGMTDDDQVEMAADTITETGRKLTSLSEKARQIQNALDTAETTESVDVAQVVRQVADDQREAFPEATIRTDVPDSCSASAIPALELAVENVIENAAKHSEAEEPTVDVGVASGEDGVYLSVADDGPGIPEQERNVLTKGRETALEHGSGLGLWLVYWVVDKSGGTLHFDDNSPQGSVVTMVLDAPEEATGPTVEADSAGAVEAPADD
jgi:signal transduction histidine kinase